MTDHDHPPPRPVAPQEPGRGRPSWRVVGAVAVVLILLAEVAVRAIEPALPTPAGWPDTATATKVEQLDRRQADGCTDVVFVGNSMARDDLDPGVFTAADPARRTAYNAALDAASPVLLRRWVQDHVLPSTHPATVVIGLATFDLNDAAATPAAARRSFDAAPFTADGALADVEAAFTRHVALIRNREALRRPDRVVDAVSDRLAGRAADRPTAEGIDGVLAADGHGLSRRDLVFRGDRSTVERMRRQFLDPFRIDGVQGEALRALVGHIESAGAMPVIVVLPVTDAYVAAHPNGGRDVAAFRAALAGAVEGTSTVVVDAPGMAPGEFADTQHLNGAGADALSAALPGIFRRADVPVRHCQLR